MTNKKQYWNFKNTTENAELYIYGDISSYEWDGSVSANLFKSELELVPENADLTVYVNSFGGEVAEGLAIGNMLKRRKGKTKCVVDGFACSIASVIATSCTEVSMYNNSMLMIHNASTFVGGNSADFRKVADDLDNITASLRQTYLEKAGDKLTEEKLVELMDNESWLSAKECLELGLADNIIESPFTATAKVDKTLLTNYKNVPEDVLKEEPIIKNKVDEEPIVDNKVLELDNKAKEVEEYLMKMAIEEALALM